MFAVVEDGAAVRVYWVVDDKPKRSPMLQRLRNLERHPAAEILVDGYEEDWDRLWWVRASGTGRVVAAEERAAGIEALRAKYPQYREASLDGPVVAIDIAAIAGWTASRDG